MAQNVKQGLAWIQCRFWKSENSVTWSTSVGNIFWSFLIYKVIYITNGNWKYLVFTQIQQYIPPCNKFLHLTKTMFLYIFLRFSTVSDNISDHANISLIEISRFIQRIYFWILLILQLSCLGSKFQQYSIWIVNFNTISPYSSKVYL